MLPVSPDFIEGVECLALADEGLLGAFGPPEGVRLLVVVCQIIIDCGLGIVDSGVTAASDTS